VLSRLQRFDFKRIGSGDIRARLESVLAQEKVTGDPEALAMISRAADGSMRDALSLTDQVLAMGNGAITPTAVRDALGLVPEDEYIGLLDIIAERRAADVFPFVERLAEAGIDFGQFLAGLGEILRAQLSVALGGDAGDLSEQARRELHTRKDRLLPADLLRMLTAMGEGEIRFKRSGQQQLLVETLLVRFALLDRTVQLEDVLKAIGDGGSSPRATHPANASSRPAPDDMRSTAPRPVPPSPRNTVSAAPSSPQVDAVLAREVVRDAPAKALPMPDLNAITGRWDELVERVRASGKALLGAALHASVPHAITRNGDLTIRLDEPNDFHAKAIEQDAPTLVDMLGDWFGGLARVQVYREDAPRSATVKPQRVTDEMVKAERLNMLRRKDPVLDAAIDVLDLEISD
jgi:DNA polymerase-3 subunit gamma/tau